MKKGLQAKHISDRDVLAFLYKHREHWCTWGDYLGYMPTVQDAMPAGAPVKVQRAKMAQLIKRGLANGCTCGCRGDYEITAKGIEWLKTGGEKDTSNESGNAT